MHNILCISLLLEKENQISARVFSLGLWR